MDAESNISSRDLRLVGGSRHRFDGDTIQLSGAPILFPPLLSTYSSPKCALSEVALQTSLPVSAYCPDAQVIIEDQGGGSTSYCDCSILAGEAMVSPSVSPGTVSSNQTASSPRPAPCNDRTHPNLALLAFDCLEFERGKLRDLNLSNSVMFTLLSARKNSTNSMYYSVWQKFEAYAVQRGFSFRSPAVANVLDFLQSGLDAGLSYNTLKVQVSAFSALMDTSWNSILIGNQSCRPFHLLQKTGKSLDGVPWT